MRLGKASAYAIFATLCIAEHESQGPVQRGKIAELLDIPGEYLQKILQRLVRAQVIQSERGRGGGFRLRKTPPLTTLLEIVEAIDGPMSGELAGQQAIQSSDAAKDIIKKLCGEVAQYARSLLRKTTIQDLMGSE